MRFWWKGVVEYIMMYLSHIIGEDVCGRGLWEYIMMYLSHIIGEDVCGRGLRNILWKGVMVNLLQGASSAGPGARLCRAPTPFGGVIEIF